MPPEMKFKTEMWHPNSMSSLKKKVYTNGVVCISILHPPGTDQFNEQEKETERYKISNEDGDQFQEWSKFYSQLSHY